MKLNQILSTLIGVLIVISIPKISFEEITANQAQQNYGIYYIPDLPGWNYASAKSSGDYYVFENAQNNLKVSILKEPWLCETKQDFNKKILEIIQGLFKTQEFMEQRKQAVPYSCLGQTNFHMLKIKPRTDNLRKFVFNPLIGDKMYSVEIANCPTSEPPAEALNFMSLISLEPGNETLAQNQVHSTQQNNQNQNVTAQNQPTQSTQPTQDLSTFKKDKSVPPLPPTPPPTKPSSSEKTQNQAPKSESSSSQNKATKPINIANQNIKVPTINIEKGEIPNVKFSATDPCSPNNPSEKGLPWETEQISKINLPEGVDVTIPSPIAGVNQLTDLAYNSAVSSAFEAMNLVYGEMPEKEAKEFQAAWAPMFDFPSQEVIDYLNKLNPIVSQFLICREAYARNFAAIQMLLLDAATAIEFDEQQAWEAAMAEASMYSSSLPSLETAMKQLIKKLEVIGNPPNPVAAKCEAQRRYKSMLPKPEAAECSSVFDGEWFGYSEGHTYSTYLNVQPVHVLFYSMPMKNPFLEDLVCGTEGFLMELQYDNYPATTEIKLTSEIINGLSANKSRIEFLSEKTWQNKQYIIKTVLTKVIDQLPTPHPQISEKRLRELEKIHEDLEKKLGNLDDTSAEYDAIFSQFMDCDQSIQRLSNSVRGRPHFHAAATQWLENLPLENNEATLPSARINEFNNIFSEIITNFNTDQPQQKKQPSQQQVDQVKTIELSPEEQYKKDAIAQHTEMVGIIKHNLDRDIKEKNEVMKLLSQAKSQKEADEHIRRIKEFDLRIIGLQSEIQAEQDLVSSYQTGQLVHTRTAFDNYAQYNFINGIKEEVANIEATRRISERIERQIKLLPEEQREKARELARTTLNGETIASGDIEKAKKLVNAFGKQIEGYAGYDYAQAKEEEAYAEIKEQAAQAGIMIVGIGAVGFGSAALVEAYGAEAAAAIYGPKILGAIYGGTTGLVRGGPKEGMSQALMGWSPNGYAVSQFIDGYQQAGQEKGATTSSQAWEGAKQAGHAWVTGKVFELGISGLTKGLLAWRGPNSKLFKPVIQTSAQKSRQLQDVLRSKQQELEAKDIVQTFEKMENELVTLKMDEVKNAIKIGQMEDELQQLTASMNASYNAKWHFKYTASPRTMRAFDRRVQKNYASMEPGIVQRMDAMGYKMDRMEFKQFRNAGSGGTSSMDLDLVPVRKGSAETKTIFMKKDGTLVETKQFMDDCQKAMDAEYKQLTGITAKSSDMNLVTSAHEEAFATSKLLDKNIDMSSFTEDEIKSIGDVLKVKMDGIDKNKMMTNTIKLQARCRESSKEIDNMLLRKLDSDLQSVPAGSAKAKEIQSKIAYWEKMGKRFKQIGMETAEPMQIIEQSRQIRRETGGRDVNGVIDDLIASFGTK